MDFEPLISVCIPSYNNQDFIAATLESLRRQTYGNFEIVITDDHSTDGTVSVINSFADSRIKLVENQSNLGMGENWNKVLSFAAGKYVKLLCGDDVLYPDCLSRQVEALERPCNSRLVLAVCGSDVINANNEIVLRRRTLFPTGQVNGRRLIRNCVRWGTNLIGEPAVGLFRREILAKPGLLDPSNPFVLDLAFWAQVLKHGDAFADGSRLVAFRISTGSVSAKVGLNQAACFRRFVRSIRMDPAYRATVLDVMMGCFLSFQWCFLRNLLVNLQAAKKDRKR